MDAASHFATLACYNVWATQRLLDAVALLDDHTYRRDLGLFFRSVHGTLNHLRVGEHLLWFRRFSEGVSPMVQLDAEAEPDRQALAQRLTDGAAQWEPYLRALPEPRFASTIDYVSTKGVATSLPFASTLAHVFNHGTHHRGQITAELTAQGLPCPQLDLVYFLQMEATK
jgi:uncharacterized damage-inducible protein DinB